jgi:hypothetical protein
MVLLSHLTKHMNVFSLTPEHPIEYPVPEGVTSIPQLLARYRL